MTVIEEEISSCLGNGRSFPGFRFHPTDEELVLYYLKGKICRSPHMIGAIAETDVYKWDPEELPGLSKLKTEDRQWFFYSPRDRKYPNGGRSNRATMHGYWKATGKDRIIPYKSRNVGVKKTLVFYIGRAPTGKRTDWVMHEYTLDEDELKRCKSAKDYYALYKVFKKSGPGPKNGEQYGAPFREEDWADEESEKNGPVDREISVEQIDESSAAVGNRVCCQLQPLEGLEELVNGIADESAHIPPTLSVADYGYPLEDGVHEEEAQSTLVDHISREVNILEQSIDLHPASQQIVNASFDLTQSGTSQLQLHEASEVTSAPESLAAYPHAVGENLVVVEEDFLEMDDLIGPQPMSQSSENPMAFLENLQFTEFDGLSEMDLYPGGPLGFNGFETGQQANFFFNDTEQEPINYEQTYLSNAQDANFQQWSHDQRSSIYTAAESHQGTIPPAIQGVVYDDNFSNHGSGADQNQSGRQNDGTDSFITSALWAYVESIPTTPASASEIALVNRAFERMSSFGRLRINSRNTNVAAEDTQATSRSSGKRKSGFFCFSLIVVMFAILWMLIGTSIGVVGR